MEAFLEARDIMAPIREEICESLSTLSEARRGQEIEYCIFMALCNKIDDFFKFYNREL